MKKSKKITTAATAFLIGIKSKIVQADFPEPGTFYGGPSANTIRPTEEVGKEVLKGAFIGKIVLFVLLLILGISAVFQKNKSRKKTIITISFMIILLAIMVVLILFERGII